VVAIFGLLEARPLSKVDAAQITTRSITMSSSNAAAAANSNTYQIRFTAASSYTVKAIVVDFCSNDPIVGDATCTAPTGFDVGGATPTIITSSGTDPTLSATLGTGWTGAGTNLITGSQYRTLTITNSTGVAVTSASVVSFDMSNVTNPTTVGSFYARILTYTTTTTGYAPGSEGSYSDYGGVALSTAALITITSRVQEQLSFCVYISSCGTAATLNLGDSHDVLSTTAPAIAAGATYGVYYSLSTNASHGAMVYLKGSTLTSGAYTIPAAGSSAFTYSGVNNDFFGLCTYNSALTAGSAPTVIGEYQGVGAGGTCAGATNNSGGTLSTTNLGTPYATFGFNSTNTGSTYGDQLASIAAPGSSVNAIVLAAGVNATQGDGIYSTTLQLIATGAY
jgi:hypothetical protein